MSDAREQTERTADRIRDELLTTLKELDRRRLQATDVRFQLQQHVDLLIVVGGGIALLAGAGIALVTYQRATREKRLTKQRVKSLRRAWQHPERLATKAEDKPMPMQVGRKVLTAFLVAMGTQLAKRAAFQIVPRNPQPDQNQYYQ